MIFLKRKVFLRYNYLNTPKRTLIQPLFSGLEASKLEARVLDGLMDYPFNFRS
jgi:hypothetical protein